MSAKNKVFIILCGVVNIIIMAVQPGYTQYSDYSLRLGIDYRIFPHHGDFPGQEQHYPSLIFEPEYFIDFDDLDQSLTIHGFIRWDAYDRGRSHLDIRELYWRWIHNSLELSIGLKRIFWGVAESNHLVDIINQTDFVESFIAEQKLGQPMLHLAYFFEWGTIEAFYMPIFRKRQFPSLRGRLRSPVPIITESSIFESRQSSWALRWSHVINYLDIGIYHFHGINRETQFLVQNISGKMYLKPYYNFIDQTGLDLQLTIKGWIFKLESIRRESNLTTHMAMVVGGEYTIQNFFHNGINIGLLTEYSYDERGNATPNGLNHDLFIGTRIAFNDIEGTNLLAGIILDSQNGSKIFRLKGSRRFASNWKFGLEMWVFGDISRDEIIYSIRNDHFFQFSLNRYF